MAAFEHSSERWKGASYPDSVQITEMNDMRMAMPFGHSVSFCPRTLSLFSRERLMVLHTEIVPQTSLLGLNLGLVFVVAHGIMMITIAKKAMLTYVETVLKIAIWRVGREDRTP